MILDIHGFKGEDDNSKYGRLCENPGDAPMNLSDFRRLCVYGEPEQVRAAIKNGVDLKEGGEY